MVKTGARLIFFLLFLGAHYTSEAAFTWTNPASANGAATPSIAENTTVGTTSVTIAATSDGGGSVTYTIGTQPPAGKLTIASSGLLSLAAGKSFDFETEPTYVLTVIATDGGDKSNGTATVTLSITNVNEPPIFASSKKTATVPDASTGGTLVTTVTATDVDASDTRTYTITGGNTNADFALDRATGAITVANGKTLAADTLPAYTLIVTATDAGSLTTTATVSIAVLKDGAKSGDGTGTDTGTAPIVKDPVFSASYSPCIADKSPAGTTLTTITATVKDTSDTFTYAIVSGDPGKNFTIDPNSGLIKVNVGKTLDKAATPSYNLVVTAADKVVTTKTGTTTVSVTVADSCDSGTAIASVSVMMLIVSLFMTLF